MYSYPSMPYFDPWCGSLYNGGVPFFCVSMNYHFYNRMLLFQLHILCGLIPMVDTLPMNACNYHAMRITSMEVTLMASTLRGYDLCILNNLPHGSNDLISRHAKMI